MEHLNSLAVIISAIAAILAWLSKIIWSREYEKSVQGQLAAKDAQIELLKEKAAILESLSSDRLMSMFQNTTTHLEQYNDELQIELEAAKTQIEERDSELQRLKESGEHADQLLARLTKEKHQFEEALSILTKEAELLKTTRGATDVDILEKLDSELMLKSTFIIDGLDQIYTPIWRKKIDVAEYSARRSLQIQKVMLLKYLLESHFEPK